MDASIIADDSQIPTQKRNLDWKGAKLKPTLGVLGFALVLWFTPPPEGLSVQAWHLFAIFVSTILGIIVKPVPMGALAILSLVACTVTKTLTIQQALSSFSSKTVWLIVIAFLLARGFVKTGLGARIAYYFVLFLGKSTLGLSYGLLFTDFILAPFIPSNTARGAGILFPIVSSLSKEYDSHPSTNTERKIGAYLIKICFHANIISSTMFMTAMAANPLMATFALEIGVEITWLSWAKAAIIPGLCSLVALPLVVYFIYPPEVKKTPEAKVYAQKQLAKMGPLTLDEMLMLLTFGLLLTLWIFGSSLGIDATSAAFIGLGILLFTGVLEWDDILNEKNGWNTFIWLTTLLMMTTFLAKFGMMTWFSERMHGFVTGHSWWLAMSFLALVYFYSHYLFASLTAHVTSMYSAFIIVAVMSGAPPLLVAMVFAFFSNLSACVTHYGTGTAPVYFGMGYVTVNDWWRIGGILSIVNILIWTIIGGSWWKIIGIW